jgi:Xaa-Pro aminopeptidase
MEYVARQESVRQTLGDHEAEALIVVAPANVRYLTGFRGEGLLLVGEKTIIATDGRFQREAEAAEATERLCERQSHWKTLAHAIRVAGYSRVAFEAQHASFASIEDLRQELAAVELVPVRGIVENFRTRKTEPEIGAIREAAAISDQALDEILQNLSQGRSEKMTAVAILGRMLELGADAAAFETIVACGPGAAEPHHSPTDAILRGPAVLKIDLGARLDGYCSDLTRTVYLGKPDDTFRKVYAAVYEAQARALEAIQPGVRASEVDRAAREVIERAGFAENFGHGLGHGVGLEVHEAPKLDAKSNDVLEEGHVVTVEPGIYIEGWGGVRIEDLVVVRKDGPELLSHARKIPPASL